MRTFNKPNEAETGRSQARRKKNLRTRLEDAMLAIMKKTGNNRQEKCVMQQQRE